MCRNGLAQVSIYQAPNYGTLKGIAITIVVSLASIHTQVAPQPVSHQRKPETMARRRTGSRAKAAITRLQSRRPHYSAVTTWALGAVSRAGTSRPTLRLIPRGCRQTSLWDAVLAFFHKTVDELLHCHNIVAMHNILCVSY